MYAITDVIVRSLYEGIQILVFCENGYGASIIRHKYSYGGDCGLFEIAVIKGDKDEWNICYDTDITDDVLGHLNDTQVAETIEQIRELSNIE